MLTKDQAKHLSALITLNNQMFDRLERVFIVGKVSNHVDSVTTVLYEAEGLNESIEKLCKSIADYNNVDYLYDIDDDLAWVFDKLEVNTSDTIAVCNSIITMWESREFEKIEYTPVVKG